MDWLSTKLTAKNVDVKTEVVYRNDWYCPHCKQQIQEKSLYSPDCITFYHRGCVDKGPIILPKRDEKLSPPQFNKNVFDTDDKNLKRDVELEREAIDTYREHIKITDKPHVRKLLEHIIREEEHHVNELGAQLKDLNKPVPKEILVKEVDKETEVKEKEGKLIIAIELTDDMIEKYRDLEYKFNHGGSLTDEEEDKFLDMQDEVEDEIKFQALEKIKGIVERRIESVVQDAYQAIPRTVKDDIVTDAAERVHRAILNKTSLKDALDSLDSDMKFDEQVKDWIKSFLI